MMRVGKEELHVGKTLKSCLSSRCLHLVATLLFLLAPDSSAKTVTLAGENHIVDQWSVEDGIPGTQILSLAQSDDGYLWLGTFYGLARFDGLRFQIFDADAPGFPSGAVNTILPAHQGDLWLSIGGSLVHYRNREFETVWHAPTDQSAMATPTCLSASGEIIFSVRYLKDRQVALFQFNGNERVELIRRPMSVRYHNQHIVAALDDHGTLCWRYGDEIGFIEPGGEETSIEWSQASKVSKGPIKARLGGFWFITSHECLRYSEGQWFHREIPPVAPSKPGPHQLLESSDGTLWRANSQGQLQQFQLNSNNDYELIQEIPLPRRGLICIDKEGVPWIAGSVGGSHLSRLRHRLFYQPFKEAIPHGVIHCISKSSKGDLLFGTNSGVYVIQTNAAPHTQTSLKLRGGAIYSLSAERRGQIFAGKYSYQSQQRKPSLSLIQNRTIKPLQEFEPLHNVRITSLCLSRVGELWIGLSPGGLARLENEHLYQFSEDDGFANLGILSLEEDSNGGLWIGTSRDGLYHYQDGKFTRYLDGDRCPAQQIRALHWGYQNTLWIGTGGQGILRFQNNEFSQFTRDQGLPTNEINTLIEDQLGFLWFGSYNGVHRVALSSLDRVMSGQDSQLFANSFTQADGLSTLQCTIGHPASYRAPDGRLMFATIRSVNVVDPKSVPNYSNPPSILITDVLLNGEPQTMFQDNAQSPISVERSVDRIEIQYTAISFSAPRELRFKYRLHGRDTHWSSPTGQRTTVFEDLKPGNYRFEVTAANRIGVWNPQGQTVYFIVQGPIWQKRSVQVLITVAATLLLFAALFGYRSRIQNRQRKQEQFARDVLQRQESDRKHIARELHDSLEQNLLVVKNRAALSLQGPGDTAEMTKALEEIAAISDDSIEETRSIANHLRPYQIDRLGITKAIQTMLNQIAQSSAITIEHEIEPAPQGLLPELQINLYRIVQETLNNILKHANANHVTVTLLVSRRYLTIRIRDNGVGFDPSRIKEERRGLGLSAIRERASLFKARCELRTAPGDGTEWMIRFPLTS